MQSSDPDLLPCPRFLKRTGGVLRLPDNPPFAIDSSVDKEVARSIAARLRGAGFRIMRGKTRTRSAPVLDIVRVAPKRVSSDGYELDISGAGIVLRFSDSPGLRSGVATVRQLVRQFGRALPTLEIRDWPDFPRRGFLLDVSRGRVPNLATLFELADHLADFKINELQLYTEHTFAYRRHRPVWKDTGALTAGEIRRLDARCRQLGIDLVPNQNSFGHLRRWLEHPPLKKLAEVSGPYEGGNGEFLRYPSTLAPCRPESIRFLRGLYDELLPNFSSRFFNVGCDETWDLGRGQSREHVERSGKGRVYVDFLRKIHREVSRRGRTMMFWGDIVLNHPALIQKLPRNVVALNWGYEANHPFERESRKFAAARIPFYVCPGTSTWMTMIGRHDNAFLNLRRAAAAGVRSGAVGYLIADWGDGGHPQPLAVSYIPLLAGASLSWCGKSFDSETIVPVLSRDVFADPTRQIARAAMALGFAHRKFGYFEENATPFGATIAAPPRELRELFCRNGLKYFARISERNIRSALNEVGKQQAILDSVRSQTPAGELNAAELRLAAALAGFSCKVMLWHRAIATNKQRTFRKLAQSGLNELKKLEREFLRLWRLRNKPAIGCAEFFRWRRDDYRRNRLHYDLEEARR